MIGTGEGYLVGLSLRLTLLSPLESPNPVVFLPVTFLGAPLGLCFLYESVSYCCSFRHLMD